MTEMHDRSAVMPIGDMDVLIEPDGVAQVTAEPKTTIFVNRITMTNETSQAFDVIALRVGGVVYGTSEIRQHIRRSEFLLLGWIVVYVGQEIELMVVNKTTVAAPFIATLIGKTPEATL